MTTPPPPHATRGTTARGWRGLPVNLLLGVALVLVWSAVLAGLVLTRGPEQAWSTRIQLIDTGIQFAFYVLAAAGLRELARRRGRGVGGLKLAAWAFVAAAAVAALSGLVYALVTWRHAETVFAVMSYVWFAPHAAILGGLAVASWGRPRRAAACVVVGLVAMPPPLLRGPLYGWLKLGARAAFTLPVVLFTICAIVYLVLAAAAADAAASDAPDPAAASGGLRTCGRALWLRVIAALGVVVITLMAMSSHHDSRSLVDLVRLATLAGAVINVIALAWFGLGAARAAGSRIDDVPRLPVALGAAAFLWAAGASAQQASVLYRVLYRTGESFGRSDAMKQISALSVALPLVVIAGVGILAVAIGTIGSRRGSHVLGEVPQKGAACVVLMLLSVAIQTWLLPEARSLGGFATMSLLAGGAGLVATVLMAKLCTLAADELEREPGLPEAKLV